MRLLRLNRLSVTLTSGAIVLALFAWTAARTGAQGAEGRQGRGEGQGRGRGAGPARPEMENVLAGVIEMHAHHDPDEQQRGIDAIDLAFYARLRGMRGLVLKSHGQ